MFEEFLPFNSWVRSISVLVSLGIQTAQFRKSSVLDSSTRVVYKMVCRSSDLRISWVSIRTCHPASFCFFMIPTSRPRSHVFFFNMNSLTFNFRSIGMRVIRVMAVAERDKGGQEFEYGEGQHQLKRVGTVSPAVEQMGHPTQNNEGNEFEEYPFERNVGTADKVKELNWDGKIGNCNQEVTHFLTFQNAFSAPKPHFLITITPGKSRYQQQKWKLGTTKSTTQMLISSTFHIIYYYVFNPFADNYTDILKPRVINF